MLLTHSNLQLEGYYVKSLRCLVEPGLDESARLALTSAFHVHPSKVMQSQLFEPECIVEVGQHVKDKSRFRVLLRVKSGKEVAGAGPLPYQFDITLVGYFRLAGIKPTSPVQSYAVRNAATILYSSARELLASVTGRGPFPGLVLPTVSFIDDNEGTPRKASTKLPAKKKPPSKKPARKK